MNVILIYYTNNVSSRSGELAEGVVVGSIERRGTRGDPVMNGGRA